MFVQFFSTREREKETTQALVEDVAEGLQTYIKHSCLESESDRSKNAGKQSVWPSLLKLLQILAMEGLQSGKNPPIDMASTIKYKAKDIGKAVGPSRASAM